MKRVIGKYPYNEYYLYIVFHKKESRRYANLIPIDKNSLLNRKTISYARYLMSVEEGRILDKEEHVDHIDNNKLNDVINNLQILTLKENNIKASKLRGRKMVVLKCPNCSSIFKRPKNQTHLQKGSKYTGCGRVCSTTFGARLRNNPDDKDLLQLLKDNVVEEYTKHT